MQVKKLDKKYIGKCYWRFYFIHIPKTSGTRLSSLEKNNRKFKTLGHHFCKSGVKRIKWPAAGFHARFFKKNVNKKMFNDPKTLVFSIIRNPFDLLASYYFHSKKDYTGWGGCNNIHNFSSFAEFIHAYCDPTFVWHVPELKKNIFSQLFDEHGQCKSHIIIKYEYLGDGIRELNRYFGANFNADVDIILNKSRNKSKNYKKYYDTRTIKLVEEKCAKELAMFGYDFGGSLNDKPIIISSGLTLGTAQ